MKLYKKIYLIGIAALAAIACDNEQQEISTGKLSFLPVFEEAYSAGTKSGLELQSESGETFFTLEALPATKSAQINNEAALAQQFPLFVVEAHEENGNLVDGTAEYNQQTSLWDFNSTTPVYWHPDLWINFIAIASKDPDVSDDILDHVNWDTYPYTAQFSYTLPAIEDQNDFLLGYGSSNRIIHGVTTLTMNHPLASILFKVGNLPLGATLKVNSITLYGIDASAQCDVTLSQASSTQGPWIGSTYEWYNHAGRVNYTQAVANPTEMSTGTDIFDATTAFMVIPRRFPNDSEAKIIINITENGRDYDLFAPLAGQEWLAGYNNTYALSYHGDNKAVLIDGPTFNSALNTVSGDKSEIEKIVFRVQQSTTAGTQVQAPGSMGIYMTWSAATKTIYVQTADYEIFTGSSCLSMFQGLSSLTSIVGMDKVNTKDAVNMGQMFYGCSSLIDFPTQYLDTRNVTNMAHMFRSCEAVSSLDLSSFSSENLTSMQRMFTDAKNLSTVTFSDDFKAYDVEDFAFLFQNTKITTADYSNWEPSKARDIEYMFDQCKSLTSVNLANFGLSNSTLVSIRGTFSGCNILASINLGAMTLEGVDTQGRSFDSLNGTGSSLPDGGLSITCTTPAQTKLRYGGDGTGRTGINESKITWNIVDP